MSKRKTHPQPTTELVYKLGRPLDDGEGCWSFIEELDNYVMRYEKGKELRPRFPAFVFRYLSDLRAYACRGYYRYGEEMVVWEAQAQGVRDVPGYIVQVEFIDDIPDFWEQYAKDPDRVDEVAAVMMPPDGACICDAITLVRLLAVEEVYP